MDVNEFTASGLLNGEIVDGEREGAKIFTLSLKNTSPNAPSPTEDFMCVAFGNSAAALEGAKSGSRLVIQGRLASEKEGDIYHSVLSVVRVLGVIEDSSQGSDFARAFLGGDASASNMHELSNDRAVSNLNIVNRRTFRRKDKSEVTIRTFARATLWNDLAKSIEYPLTDAPVIVEGSLRPSEWEGAKKLEVWADTISFVGSSVTAAAEGAGASSAPAAAAPTPPPPPPARARVQDDDPFG